MIANRLSLISTLRTEYYEGFLRDGGSSVRVFVGGELELAELKQAIVDTTDEHVFLVDGSVSRLHTLVDFYHSFASDISWDAAAYRFVCQVFDSRGWVIPDRENPTVQSISRANGIDARIVRSHLDRDITDKVIRNRRYCNEFARGIQWIITSAFDTGDAAGSAVAFGVKQWLVGTIPHMRFVRGASLYRKINRKNARIIFQSTCRFLRDVGYQTITLLIDATAYTSRGQYTKLACTDLYEVIRQFIDGLEELDGVALMFFVTRGFIDDAARGLDSYQALKMRLAVEAFDPRRPNLSAPMVVLGYLR